MLKANEIADVIERFLNNKLRYPQEWNDFVEARPAEKQLQSYRKRCQELDPLVNRPGNPDNAAIAELKQMISEIRSNK